MPPRVEDHPLARQALVGAPKKPALQVAVAVVKAFVTPQVA